MFSQKLNQKVKVPVPKVSIFKSDRHFSVAQLLAFVIIFAGIGGYIIYSSLAATPTVASLEAEQLSLPTGASAYTDSTASGGKAVQFTVNGTATGSVTIPTGATATSLAVTAHGNSCHGWANLSLSVDGTNVLPTISASTSSWTNYVASTNLVAGSHSLSMSAGNMSAKGNCTRNLYVDVATFYGPAPSITPAPTISFSATPTTVSSGSSSTLTWSATSATSCTASGAWSGTEPTSGSQSTGALNASATYNLSCTGAGGTTAATPVTVTVSTSTSVNWPASYTDGPLGAKEILPKSSSGALFIEWAGTIGLTAQLTRNMVLQRMTDTGRTFNGIGTQLDQLTVNGVTSEQWIKSLGSFPLITWSPSASPTNVANGSDDSEIAGVANRLKSLGSPVIIRPWHEFNGTWFPWSATVSTCPTWTAGWRHMVGVFQQNGATNVGFDWSTAEGADRAVRDACYPGDNYVDWVSSDGYNGCLGTLDWCTPLHNGWATFREMFDYTNMGSTLVSTYSAYGAKKPFVVAETSSKCNPNDVNAKGNWFRDIDAVAKPAMPYLRGVEFFDQDVSSAEAGNDWKVDTCPVEVSSPASYSGWIDLSKTADWNVGY